MTACALFGNPPDRPLCDWTTETLVKLRTEIRRNGAPNALQREQLRTIADIIERR